MVWGCEKLTLYLAGTWFRAVTDNRAVQFIFSNPNSKPPARIERWALRFTIFHCEIVHRPSKYNIADYFSRHPLPCNKKKPLEKIAVIYVAFVSEQALPKAVTSQECLNTRRTHSSHQALEQGRGANHCRVSCGLGRTLRDRGRFGVARHATDNTNQHEETIRRHSTRRSSGDCKDKESDSV